MAAARGEKRGERLGFVEAEGLALSRGRGEQVEEGAPARGGRAVAFRRGRR